MWCWRGLLSKARCRLFTYYGPANAAIPRPVFFWAAINPEWFYLSDTGLPIVLEKRPLSRSLSVCFVFTNMIQHETFDVGYAVFAVCLLAAVRRTLDIFIGTARIVCGAGSMKSVRLFVCLSQHGHTTANPLLQSCCCGPADRRYRSTVAACSSGMRLVNAGSATLSAYVSS